ncbi:hypothetical protein F4801DRAFT_584914 [Xylaria longipes]|nr:hypothetical protein F4801DRAFT_584914 [Xylaria longipes]
MPSGMNYPNRLGPGARSFTPEYSGQHTHTSGFSHEPRKTRPNSRSAIHKPKYSEQHQQYLKDSWEELVESTPRQDAGVAEVRTWILKVFHRRCHPDPEKALSGFHWKGRDLHSQRRYLALRLRFRREPYGYLIAHDIHDAVKEFRKRARKQEREARKQMKKAKKTANKSPTESGRIPAAQSSLPMSSHVRFRDSTPNKGYKKAQKARKEQADLSSGNREPYADHQIGEAQPQDIETSTSKAKKKFVNIFTTKIPGTSSSKTVAASSLFREEDPFRDPSPSRRRVKPKEKKKAKKKKKVTASLESLNSARDPFRDPSPMRLVDADDFRL